MENIKNGFLWGLGFGLSIMLVILTSQYFDPSGFEKIKNQTPTTVKGFEIISKVNRVEKSNFIIAGEFKVNEDLDFERYKIYIVIRNEKGLFLQECSSDIDKYSVEIAKKFTKVVVCRGFSDTNSVSLVEINLIGFK